MLTCKWAISVFSAGKILFVFLPEMVYVYLLLGRKNLFIVW